MTKPTDNSHHVHIEVEQELAENIGYFMVHWGHVENELDHLFPVLFRVDPTLAVCITANLGTKPKVEMLQSALNMIAPALPPEAVADLDEVLAMTLDYSGRYRNLLAHGRPIVFLDDEDGEQYWHWGRYAARKQLTMLVPDTDADFWRMHACVLGIITEGLADARVTLNPIIQSMSPEDWGSLCIIRHTKP